MAMKDEPEKENGEDEIIYEDADEFSAISSGQLQEKNKKLKEKLKRCNEEKAEYLSGWQREKADFINYRRRQEKQTQEWLKMAQAGVISDLLPIVDALEAAAKNQEGIEMILKQLIEVLKKHGLEEIQAIGEKFNPELHEAVEMAESDEEEGIVIEEIQKGYKLNGKVIRTSKVKVSK